MGLGGMLRKRLGRTSWVDAAVARILAVKRKRDAEDFMMSGCNVYDDMFALDR